MSLTTPTAQPPTSSSLSVDELEAKLVALHDYLSTSYRSRAEAILQHRRRRERHTTDPFFASPALLEDTSGCTSADLSTTALPFPTANAPHSSHDAAASALAAASVASHVHVRNGGAEVDVVESPARSLLFDSAPLEGRTRDGVTERGIREEEEEGKRTPSHESAPYPALKTATHNAETGAAHTQRRIARLEWQVEMLADALEEERTRFNAVQKDVVRPLQALVEASVRRQVELEAELARWRAGTQPH